MSEFWKRKVRKYFSTIDLDSDGVVSKEDFVGMAINFSKFGEQDKQRAEHLKAEFENVWAMYVTNDDRDSLTANELIVSVEKLRHDPEFQKPVTAIVHHFHDMLDVNNDGYLQEEEYQRMLFQNGILDQSIARVAFAAIDINGDGKLSIEEFSNAFLEFLFSEDEKSPYAFFFGPLDN